MVRQGLYFGSWAGLPELTRQFHEQIRDEMMRKDMAGNTPTIEWLRETDQWDSNLDKLYEWDPDWAEKYLRMAANPWTGGILPIKTIELICIGLNAACTNLQPSGTRLHIRAALKAGGTCEEILMVLKMASGMSIHSCSLGAPLLLEEAKTAGRQPTQRSEATGNTPACDKMREVGQWNQAWNPFYELDPVWTDEFMSTAISIYGSGLMTPKLIELLSIAFDASFTHMYAPGTRRHIKAALKLGATVEEIMEVLKVCVARGSLALSLAVPILDEELANLSTKEIQP